MERQNKKGGGVGFLIAQELHYKCRKDLNIISKSFELCFIELISKGRNILCGSGYRPLNTNVKDFLHNINGVMAKIKLETHKNIVIGLDHNLDFLKSSDHQPTETFICSILDNSLFPCITRPTRVTKSTATLIDNILVNSRIYDLQQSCVITHDISDHFPCLTSINDIWVKKREAKKIVTRELNECKLASLKNAISQIDWNSKCDKSNASTYYADFISLINNELDIHVPLKEIVIPAKQYICEPWLTKSL